METNVKDISKNIRLNILRLTYGRGKNGAHVAPSLSMTEIISVLFTQIMDWNKDIFILSKGHGGLAYYCGLKEAGRITQKQLDTFDADGGDFPGQPSKNVENSIVFSSGSLGMGLSYGVGRALAGKNEGSNGRVFVMMGDGELNEGSVWEGAMLASQLNLDNLLAVVDWNGMQSDGKSSDIVEMDLPKIWKSFGWNVVSCNGHDEEAIKSAFTEYKSGIPTVILAKTIKGKGVSFMENNKSWHHHYLTEEQYEQATKEVLYGI